MPDEVVVPLLDSHWRDVDFKTIGGFCKAVSLTSQDFIKICKDVKATRIISTGDLCDKGYRTIHETFTHRNLLQEMNDITRNQVYMVIGNHFFLERDTNPELYWIQPHQIYKPIKSIYAKEPLLKTPNQIMVNCMQISLFHYNKHDKNYVNRVSPDARYHCGFYHDDTVVPAHVRIQEGIDKPMSVSYVRTIFDNIDLAVMGHIHTPYGLVTINLGGKEIPVDIPGSAAIVTSKPSDLHTSIKIPVFTITDKSYKKEYVELSLHTNELKFYRPTNKAVVADQEGVVDITTLSNNDIRKLIAKEHLEGMSAFAYLEMGGCSEYQMKLFELAQRGVLNTLNAMKVYKGEEVK